MSFLDPATKADARDDESWVEEPAFTPNPKRRLPSLALAVERERIGGNGPVAFALSLALGAAHYGSAPREIGWLAVLALLAFTIAGVKLARSATIARGLAILVLGFTLGMAAAKVEVVRTGMAMMVGEATTRVVARVASSTIDAKGRVRYDVAIERTHDPTLQFAPDRARIFVSAKHDRMAIGTRFEALTRLRQPGGPARPGGYDFAFYNYFDGLGAQGFMLGRPTVLDAEGPIGVREHAEAVRQGIATITRSQLDPVPGGVAAALITGNKRGIPDDVNEVLRGSGLAHVLAISGLHMALVSGLVIVVARLCMAAPVGLASSYPTRKIAACAALAVASVYLVLSGASVSAMRSYIMLCVMLVAVLCDRPALTMRNIGIAAIVVILIQPHAVSGPGFQMSFGATAALVATYGTWRDVRGRLSDGEPWLQGPLGSLVKFVVGLAVTSIVAGLATGLFAAYHFHRVAPFGLFANLAAMPIVSLAVMPLALLSAVAMPFGLEAPFLVALGWSIEAVVLIAERVVEWRGPIVTGIVGLPTLASCTAALAILVVSRTWLRVFAVVPFALSFALPPPAQPGLVIADRGEMVGIVRDDVIAASASRPNAFLSRQWRDAFEREVIGAGATEDAFVCENDVCTTTTGGLTISVTEETDAIGAACDVADIVVTPRRVRMDRCSSGAWVLSGLTMGQRGSLSIDLVAISKKLEPRRPNSNRSSLNKIETSELERHVRYALPASARPWTVHRYAVIKRRSKANND